VTSTFSSSSSTRAVVTAVLSVVTRILPRKVLDHVASRFPEDLGRNGQPDRARETRENGERLPRFSGWRYRDHAADCGVTRPLPRGTAPARRRSERSRPPRRSLSPISMARRAPSLRSPGAWINLACRPRLGGGSCMAASRSRLLTCRFIIARFALVLTLAFALALDVIRAPHRRSGANTVRGSRVRTPTTSRLNARHGGGHADRPDPVLVPAL
jgi:hypothetical protein